MQVSSVRLKLTSSLKYVLSVMQQNSSTWGAHISSYFLAMSIIFVTMYVVSQIKGHFCTKIHTHTQRTGTNLEEGQNVESYAAIIMHATPSNCSRCLSIVFPERYRSRQLIVKYRVSGTSLYSSATWGHIFEVSDSSHPSQCQNKCSGVKQKSSGVANQDGSNRIENTLRHVKRTITTEK